MRTLLGSVVQSDDFLNESESFTQCMKVFIYQRPLLLDSVVLKSKLDLRVMRNFYQPVAPHFSQTPAVRHAQRTYPTAPPPMCPRRPGNHEV